MVVKSLVFGVLLTLASVTIAHADSYFKYRGPSVGLHIGSNGIGVNFGNRYSQRNYNSGNRFKGYRSHRRIIRGYGNNYRGQRSFNSRINQKNYNRGRRDLSDNRLGDYRRYP